MKENIRVYIRTRPTANFAEDTYVLDENKGAIEVHVRDAGKGQVVNHQQSSHSFRFTKILHNSAQDVVYSTCCHDLLTSTLKGYNGTLMVYGQTGAGKTYTMYGGSDSFQYRGIIPRVLTELFKEIDARTDTQFVVRVSSMEIYNEGLYDLLSTATVPDDGLPPSSESVYGEALNIVEDTQGSVFVRNLRRPRVNTEEDALNLLFESQSNRTTAMKQAGHMSSRSHVVFTVFLEQHSRIDATAGVITSKLHLIDLAGSERDPLGKATSGLSPQQLQKEAQSINRSLTFLEQVIVALGDKKRDHIPFRSCKLTSLLKDTLGGNCRTALICNIHPLAENRSESICTLRFGERVMRVENEAGVSVVEEAAGKVKRLEREIRELKEELAMHDALTGRGRVKYGQEEQKSMNESGKAELVSEVTRFVSGEIEVDELIFGAEGGSTKTQRQAPTLGYLKEVMLALRTVARQGGGGQGVTDSRLAEERENQIVERSMGAAGQEKDEGVGSIDRNAGFGMGLAGESAPTNVLRSTLLSSKGQDAEKETKRETSANRVEETTTDLPSIHSSRGDEIELSKITNREEGFVVFKETDEGMELSQRVFELKEDVRVLKEKGRATAEKMQSLRAAIDAAQKQNSSAQPRKEDEPSDQPSLAQLKQTYREEYTQMESVRSELTFKQGLIESAERDLITSFDVWYENVTGARMGATKTRSMQATKQGQDMDEQERFDAMERERLKAENPEAIAYYSALKTQKMRKRR
ncbi:putative Kinesin-II 85 kDa subunit [Blattamonas nauphoetae]|uniref:Kinesin-like protein n=1 Tax=Blattamonas nauphoetae TaxID=2049346 RepID=A0ABQ9XSH3_9EUKA|nr:putative Kinesin-II 85 kDa subunit [Blattamonas nauphoetae]